MTIYTPEEIHKDIQDYEKVGVIIPNVQSDTLYSHVTDRSPHRATVDDLKKKVMEYIDQYCYPLTDIPPKDKEDTVSIYEGSTYEEVYTYVGTVSIFDTVALDALMPKINKHMMLGIGNEGDKIFFGKKELH